MLWGGSCGRSAIARRNAWSAALNVRLAGRLHGGELGALHMVSNGGGGLVMRGLHAFCPTPRAGCVLGAVAMQAAGAGASLQPAVSNEGGSTDVRSACKRAIFGPETPLKQAGLQGQ